MEARIYPVTGDEHVKAGFVVSEMGTWLPGVYENHATVQYALWLPPHVLRALQDSIHPDEVITLTMLQALKHKFE
jgi:hypothetical protein